VRLEDRPSAGHLLTVQLLGQFQVRLDEVAVDDWPSGRGRSLFKYLVTHRDPWPRREQLMEAFWPEAAPAAARNSLNVAVHGLRRAFRASAEVPVVVLQDGAYRLADDPYQDWPVTAREHLLLAYLDVLDRLSSLSFDQRQYGACVALCRLLVEKDPCREDGHRRLMRCFTRQGQPHLALRQYQACADALDRELGVDPDPATVTLAQRIRHHQPV
jgi:DNA-binding SARP family transcriptional activator